MTISRLVVGDDGSPTAAVARSWAERLAGATKADLSLVRVADVDIAGSAAASLLAQASQRDADLIVVGRRGSGGFPNLQLGGTVHQVAEHASMPVAVIPSVDTARHREWPLSRVAVGVDGSPAAAAATAWAASVAAAASAPLWAVHAVDVGPAFAATGLDDAAYAKTIRALSEVMEREWCAPLRDGGINYETVLEEGGAATVLLDAVRSNDIDLLVVGRRGAGAFSGLAMGSVAHRAIGFAPCPTVVVPAPT